MTVMMTSTFHESDNNNLQASPGSSAEPTPQPNSTHIHQTYNWFYDKTEIRRTPSFLDGINFERERRYRNEGARFILNVGSQMKLRYNTLATGVVYFHRFYMFHSFKVFPRYVTSACCLFLAGKAEETPKKCKDIIKIARSLLTDPQYEAFGEDPKEEVLTMERIVLQTIRFDLQVEHPYKYLATYAKGFKGNREKITTVLQMAWTFTNDSLCTTISLQWEPEIVAIAMIFLASKIKYEITDWEGRLPHQKHWWDIYVEDLTVEMLEDICHQVLDLYSPKRAEEPRADSPPMSPVGQRPGLAPLQHPHLGPTNAPVGPMSNSQANHLGSGLQPPPQPPIRSQPQPPVHSTAGNSVSLSNAPSLPPISSGNLPLIPPNLPPNAIPLRLLGPAALAAAAAAVNGQNSSAQGPPLPPPPPPIPPQWDPNSMASFYGQCPFPLPGAPQQNAGGPPVSQHLPPRLVPLGPLQPPPGLHPRGLPPLPLPPGALPRGLPPPPQPPMPPSLTFMPGQRKP